MTIERDWLGPVAIPRAAAGIVLALATAVAAMPAAAQQQDAPAAVAQPQNVSTPVAPATTDSMSAASQGNPEKASVKDRRNEWWVTTGFLTHHFQSDLDLNDNNRGAGLEYRASDDVTLTAGRFNNSDREHSRYLGVYWQPWHWGGWRFGAVAGGFDGYPRMRNGGWFPALIPTATYEYKRVGVNVAVTPTYKDRIHGGISVQLKLRLF